MNLKKTKGPIFRRKRKVYLYIYPPRRTIGGICGLNKDKRNNMRNANDFTRLIVLWCGASEVPGPVKLRFMAPKDQKDQFRPKPVLQLQNYFKFSFNWPFKRGHWSDMARAWLFSSDGFTRKIKRYFKYELTYSSDDLSTRYGRE